MIASPAQKQTVKSTAEDTQVHPRNVDGHALTQRRGCNLERSNHLKGEVSHTGNRCFSQVFSFSDLRHRRGCAVSNKKKSKNHHNWEIKNKLRENPRAHLVLNGAIKLNGAPSMSVILHELRAQVRASLGLWEEAAEDVRVALTGLEHGTGCGVDGVDSDEERKEVRRSLRWSPRNLFRRSFSTRRRARKKRGLLCCLSVDAVFLCSSCIVS